MFINYIVTNDINQNGAKHTRFIYLDDSKKIIINTKKIKYNENYIDKRCKELDGKNLYYALNKYYYYDSKNIKKKYKIKDLLYDINTRRIQV